MAEGVVCETTFTVVGHVNMPSLLERIPGDALDRPFTDFELSKISEHLLEWIDKAPAFGLSEGEVEDIREDYRTSSRTQKSAMLRRWREKNGDMANLRELVLIAEQNGWQDFIRNVCLELGYTGKSSYCHY